MYIILARERGVLLSLSLSLSLRAGETDNNESILTDRVAAFMVNLPAFNCC